MPQIHKRTSIKNQVTSVDCFNRPIEKDYYAYKSYSEEEGRESEYQSKYAFTNNSLKHDVSNDISLHKTHASRQKHRQKIKLQVLFPNISAKNGLNLGIKT